MLEEVRKKAKGATARTQPIQFVREGQKPKSADSNNINTGGGPLSRGKWEMAVDLDRQLRFPSTICVTQLRPDLVLWSEDQKSVLIIELTVPWEENIQEAYERKKLKYEELADQCKQQGWRSRVYPVEVGTRGFAGTSLLRLCRDLQIQGKLQSQFVRQVTEEAERSSFVLWIKRKDKCWKKAAQK
ncbi:uncharacterized protein LOC144868177 [Branchiostoma floridae x Branchiostoma japonicum]